MAKRNRENLMEQSMYDMLMKMNEQLQKNGAVVTPITPDGKKEDRCSACIMDCLMSSYDAEKLHNKNGADCGKCIAEWLNSYPF